MITNWELKQRARKWFADANGWTDRGKDFDILTLADTRRHHHYYRHENERMDHETSYRLLRSNGAPGKAVALVGHNYPGEHGGARYGIIQPQKLAERYGLTLHVAPAGAKASWHYPTHSVLLVMTHPRISVVWPTEEEMAQTMRDYFRWRDRPSDKALRLARSNLDPLR